jgi:hypothetical protein
MPALPGSTLTATVPFPLRSKVSPTWPTRPNVHENERVVAPSVELLVISLTRIMPSEVVRGGVWAKLATGVTWVMFDGARADDKRVGCA